MVLRVEYSLVDIPDSLRGDNSAKIIREEYSAAIATMLVDMRSAFAKDSPTGLGILRSSWITEGPTVRGKFIAGNVKSSLIQALVVDKGALLHFPPVGDEPALGPWIRRKLGITDPMEIRQTAFLIGRRFKKRGIRKRLIFTNIFKAKRAFRKTVLDQATAKIIKRLEQ